MRAISWGQLHLIDGFCRPAHSAFREENNAPLRVAICTQSHGFPIRIPGILQQPAESSSGLGRPADEPFAVTAREMGRY